MSGFVTRLRHSTTGKQLGAVNIEKIVVVPDGDAFADIRPDTEQEQTLQSATHFHLDNILVHYQNLRVRSFGRIRIRISDLWRSIGANPFSDQ